MTKSLYALLRRDVLLERVMHLLVPAKAPMGVQNFVFLTDRDVARPAESPMVSRDWASRGWQYLDMSGGRTVLCAQRGFPSGWHQSRTLRALQRLQRPSSFSGAWGLVGLQFWNQLGDE